MKKDSFVIKRIDTGKLNALVINLMEAMGTNSPAEAVANINSLKWIPQPSERGWWFDENYKALIRCNLRRLSHMRPSEWGRALLQSDIEVSEGVREILFGHNDLDFTSQHTEIVIFPGGNWDDADRITSSIIRHGTREHTFVQLKLEDACIIRDRLTKDDFKKMGLNGIVTMHEPLDGRLFVSETLERGEVFETLSASDRDYWPKSFGFAFGVVPSK